MSDFFCSWKFCFWAALFFKIAHPPTPEVHFPMREHIYELLPPLYYCIINLTNFIVFIYSDRFQAGLRLVHQCGVTVVRRTSLVWNCDIFNLYIKQLFENKNILTPTYSLYCLCSGSWSYFSQQKLLENNSAASGVLILKCF